MSASDYEKTNDPKERLELTQNGINFISICLDRDKEAVIIWNAAIEMALEQTCFRNIHKLIIE